MSNDSPIQVRVHPLFLQYLRAVRQSFLDKKGVSLSDSQVSLLVLRFLEDSGFISKL